MLGFCRAFGYKPSSGFTIGATSNLAKYFGDPETNTRISSAVVGLSYSTKQQTSLTVRFGASGRENRWRFDGDNRFQWTSQDSYGLGTGAASADSVNTRFTYVRAYKSPGANWRRTCSRVRASISARTPACARASRATPPGRTPPT